MTHKLTVGEHLRNSGLYQADAGTAPGPEWKLRLFRQYAVQSQMKALIQEGTSLFRWCIYAGIPGVLLALVFAAYFGFIHPGEWMKSVAPAVGMREALVLVAVVNGWVLVTRRRSFEGL